MKIDKSSTIIIALVVVLIASIILFIVYKENFYAVRDESISINNNSYYADKISNRTEKVLLIENTSIRDDKVGWLHVKGFFDASEKFSNINISIIEGVHDDEAKLYRMVQEYSSKGYRWIFLDGFKYTIELGNFFRNFPNMFFFLNNGNSKETNVINYLLRTYEIKYLHGLIAGRITKTNEIGYILSSDNGIGIRSVNAFALGIQKVNPNAKIHLIKIKGEHDKDTVSKIVKKLKDEKNIDVINGNLDRCQWCQVASDLGLYYFGEYSDESVTYGQRYLTSFKYNMNVVYSYFFSAISNGQRKIGNDYWFDYRQNVVSLTNISDLTPYESRIEIKRAIENLKEGNSLIFQGPVYSQNGLIVIPSDATISDKSLESMPNWLNWNIVDNEIYESKAVSQTRNIIELSEKNVIKKYLNDVERNFRKQ